MKQLMSFYCDNSHSLLRHAVYNSAAFPHKKANGNCDHNLCMAAIELIKQCATFSPANGGAVKRQEVKDYRAWAKILNHFIMNATRKTWNC